jgi:Holliday junction DNA helicase RuvB
MGTRNHMIENIIGHNNTKKQLKIAIASAKDRNYSIPHILFSGVAGCGKTTMAMELAEAAKVDFISVSPDDFIGSESVFKMLEKLNDSGYNERGDRTGEIRPTIIFVDEIHRMPRKGQEVMGIAMEKFMLETGKANKFYWIPYFTLVGATTDDGELTKPFREKFKLRFLFETYSDKEIFEIIKLHAKKQNLIITNKAARTIAQRSRGIPRVCVGFLERARDYQNYIGAKVITSQAVLDNFKNLGIDSKGLTKTEIKILKILNENRTPVGLDNLAIISNESQKNLRNTIEPFLIQQGFIIRTGKGRYITDAGIRHLESNGYFGVPKNKIEISPDYIRR